MVHRMLMALHRPWFLSALACRSRSSKTKPAQEKQDRTPLAAEASASLDASLAASATISELNESEEKKAEPENGMQPSPPAMFSLSAVLRSATWQTETFASARPAPRRKHLHGGNSPITHSQLPSFRQQRCFAYHALGTAFFYGSNEPPQAERPTLQTHFHNQCAQRPGHEYLLFPERCQGCKLAAKGIALLAARQHSDRIGHMQSRRVQRRSTR